MNDASRPTPDFDPVRSAAIRSVLVDGVVSTRSPARRRRTVMIVSIAAAAAVVLAGGTGYALSTMHQGDGNGPGSAVVDPAQTRIPAPSSSGTPAPGETPGTVEGAGTASPTPITPGPTVDRSDPETWLITFAGVGPLLASVPASEQGAYQSAYTVTSQDDPAGGFRCDAFLYEAPGRQSIDSLDGAAGKAGTLLVGRTDDGTEALPGPTTRAGIRIGSTVAEMKAAYPAIELTQDVYPDHGYRQYTIGDGSGRYLVFQSDATDRNVELIATTSSRGIPMELCN